MELYKRYRHPFAILMLDFDNLKWVNDTFGHAAGDTALTHLATVMRMNIRDVDIPCRFGGDEFLILMPEADKNAIQMVGRRIAESVNKTRFKLGRSFASLQVSFGAAACPEDGAEAEALLQEADASLYRAKEQKGERAAASRSPQACPQPDAAVPARSRSALVGFAPQSLHRVVQRRSDHREMLPAGFGAAGHVDDQRLLPHRRHRPAEHGVRRHLQRGGPHGLREPGSQTVGHRPGGFGSAVARSQTGAAGGEDQIDLAAVGEVPPAPPRSGPDRRG